MYAMLQRGDRKRNRMPLSTSRIPADRTRDGGMRRPLAEDVRTSGPVQCRRPGTDVRVIQRATVAGFRNDAKNEMEIGEDIHLIVQEVFLDDETLASHYILCTEYEFSNRRRADIVAVRDETSYGDPSDLWIYAGEIKPDSVGYNGYGDAAGNQLADYIALFRQDFRLASVGYLDFWWPSAQMIDYAGRDYTLIISNQGNGLYTYRGVRDLSKAPAAREKIDEIEDQDPDELLPYNERPDYMVM